MFVAGPVDAEQKVRSRIRRLARRNPEWLAVHGVPVGTDGAEVGPLVIGPGGVFMVEAKAHPGGRVRVSGSAFRVDDVPFPYISTSRHEALRAARCLSAACGFRVDVAGLVVLAGAEDLLVEEPSPGVHVIPDIALKSWLCSREPVLDGPTLAAVQAAAGRGSTWMLPG